MEYLKLAQFYHSNFSESKKTASEILKEVDVNYRIPLLDNYRIIHEYKWSGYISLHFAVMKRDIDLTNYLLKQGANPLRQGIEDGSTPLHVVINKTLERNNYCVEELSDKEFKEYKNKNFLEHSLINILLDKQVEIDNTLNPKNKHGITHLHIACIVNNAKAVKFFAKAKEPLDQVIVYNPDDADNNYNYKYKHIKKLKGYTPLHFAITYSSVKAANVLLQHKADVHIKNEKGLSCVHLLVEHAMDVIDSVAMGKYTLGIPYTEQLKRVESITKLVLKTTATNDIFFDDIGFTALHLACTLRDKSIVQDFLKLNLDVNIPIDNRSKFWPGWTPIHFAACFNIEIVILLIQSGADIMSENSKRQTALDFCAKRFTPADVQFVLSLKNEYKNIVLSDDHTKLMDLLLFMNDYDKFNNFLHRLEDVNVIIPHYSPIWAGCNLLHLCVYFCTRGEKTLYRKRIELCLECGCSVNMKNSKGESPIHLAFNTLREEPIVEKLLICSEENVVDRNNLTHLHIACALGQLDAVKRYLCRGANVNSPVRTSFDWHEKAWYRSEDKQVINFQANSTPLHVAVAFNHVDLVEYLLENKANVHAKDSLGFTPIHLSMFTCEKSLSRLLFERTPKLHDSVSKAGLSHLHVAAYANDPEAAKKLLFAGAEVDSVVDVDVESSCCLAEDAGKTPLHIALHSSDDGVVEALLKGGANVHAEDRKGNSVLHNSIGELDSSSTVTLRQMLKSGKFDLEGSGISLLHFACAAYDVEWAKELLKKGADVNSRIEANTEWRGATPLYVIIVNCLVYNVHLQYMVDLVKLLLDNGADVTLGGHTLLHQMYHEIIYDEFTLDENSDDSDLEEPLLQVADLLLETQKSYNVNPTDVKGFSHFHFACVRNNAEVVRKFLDNGVDINQSIDPFARNASGFTPLHFALAHKSRKVAFLLLERGADVNAKDACGNTPLHVAFKKKFVDLELIDAMLSRGADIHAKNVNDETLLHCLSKCGGPTLKRLEVFLNGSCFESILNINQGEVGLAMRKEAPSKFQPVLERLTQVFEIKSAIESGFNAIQSLVAVDQHGELTLENYLSSIEFLMGIGCKLDQRDNEGGTALHKAVSFYNLEAVNALLQLGADVNSVNYANESPLSAKVILTAKASNDSRKMDVINALARHIWKMKYIELNVNDSNLKCLEKVEMITFFDLLENFHNSCQNELLKAEVTKIGKSLTVTDFLTESAPVVIYPRISPDERACVDKFFKNTVDLRQEFPQLSGLLALQYGKALAELEQSQSAEQAIGDTKLSDLCSQVIFRFFMNNETKLIIELGRQLFNCS